MEKVVHEGLQRVLELGVSSNDDEEAVRRVQISNALYVISLFVATVTTVGPYLAGETSMARVGAFMLPTTFACFGLNALGAIRASRFLLIAALNAVMLGMASVVGAGVLAATIFVVLPIPFFLFDRTELPYLVGSVVVITVSAVLLHIPGFLGGAASPADATILTLLFQAVSFAGLLLLLVADFALRRKLTTDLKAARERAEETGRAKERFLANMSHEIRTPMGAVLGYAELLDDPEASPEQRANALEALRRNGVHLRQLLNEVLDVSKIEAGELLVEIGPVSPTEIILDAVSGLGITAADKGVALDVRLPERMPRTLRSDALRMRQVLLNLVGNAVKFTEQGSVTVTAELQPGYLVVHVTDTGIGIEEEDLPRLFERFAQVDARTARTFGGTGLGLAISKELIGLLGGRLTAKSVVGTGSTFTAAFPMTAAQAEDLVRHPEADRGERDTGSSVPSVSETSSAPSDRVRILLAEDFADAAVLVEFHLSRHGCVVTTVSDGEAAVRAIEAADPPFDLVLMDNQMPVMDGLTAIRRLRKRGERVPVISLTANAISGDRDRCIEAGADGYLTKPVDFARLFAEIRRVAPDVSIAAISGAAAPTLGSTLADLREQYRERLPLRMAVLRAASEHRDLKTVSDLAHKIVGSAGTYGLDAVGDAARALEARARAEEEGGVLDLGPELDALAAEIERCVATATGDNSAA